MPVLHQKLSLFLVLLLVGVGFAEDFRCSSCRQSVLRGYQVEGNFYCPACLYKALPRCKNCNVPIQGDYVAVTMAKHPICLSCRESLPQCFLCSMPCDENRGGQAFADGRHACAEHARNGVIDPFEARQIFAQARQELRHAFAGALELKTPVKEVFLVDLHGLARAAQGTGHSPSLSGGKVLGIATITLSTRNGRVRMEPSTVHLLNQVPPDRLLAVCSHEYAHVWHAENHKDYSKTEAILREGFAEWVAYKVAQAHGREEQMKLMLNSGGGIYYQGLQKLLELERQKGVHGVLRYAISATSL